VVGQLDHDAVAEHQAEALDDRAQPLDLDHQHAQRCLLGLLQRGGDRLVEPRPVADPGQRVGGCLAQQLLVQ